MITLELQMLRLMMLVIIYTFSTYDIRKNFTNSQPFKVEFKFDGVVPNDINGYALVLTNELVSLSSDGQRHFDLI